MTTLTFKATAADAHAFRAAAQGKRMSFSEYVRDTLRSAMEKEPPQYNDDLTPGRVIIDGPPVTTEQIHAALYDDEIPC